MLCLDFGHMLEIFDILEASVQGRAAVSETVRTQILNICRGKKNNHFLSCAQSSTFHSLNAIRETETKSSLNKILNTGRVTSDQKPIYSHNFSAAVAVVEL